MAKTLALGYASVLLNFEYLHLSSFAMIDFSIQSNLECTVVAFSKRCYRIL